MDINGVLMILSVGAMVASTTYSANVWYRYFKMTAKIDES